jgi:hypothetical protein
MFDRFVVWTETGLLGRAPSEADALSLAHRQPPGTPIYIRDSFASPMAGDSAFAVAAGIAGRQPLPAHLAMPEAGGIAPSEQAAPPFGPSDYAG